MALAAHADYRALNQRVILQLFWYRLAEGKHQIDISLSKQIFDGVKGQQPQYRQSLGLKLAQLLQGGAENVEFRGVPAADGDAAEHLLLGFLHPGFGQPAQF